MTLPCYRIGRLYRIPGTPSVCRIQWCRTHEFEFETEEEAREHMDGLTIVDQEGYILGFFSSQDELVKKVATVKMSGWEEL